MGPNWSLLPPELLESIAEKVTSLGDYIRFRAVCRPWRSASPLRPRHLPIQVPWLMLPYNSHGINDSTRLFYDLSASKIHKLDLPEIFGVEICGSSHGWLVLHNGQVTSLFNPITRDIISLPPYTVPPSHLGFAPYGLLDGVPFFETWDPNKPPMDDDGTLIVKKAILTSSPTDTSCMVFVHTDCFLGLAYCKIGDVRWTVIEFQVKTDEYDILDFTYSNGILYTLLPYGRVSTYNLINPSKMLLHCTVKPDFLGLVDGVDGGLLLISYVRPNFRGIEFIVYRLSNDEEPEWIEVTDIGQNVLFLNGYLEGISLPSSNMQWPNLGANNVWYGYLQREYDASQCNHHIKLVRLDNGMVTDITSQSFQQNRLCQRSLWLTPSFL